MSQSEARAWWADVEEVRETIERRRAAERPVPEGRRAPDAFAEVDDLAVRRRFRDRERTPADAAADDVWFDEPQPAGRSASPPAAPRAARAAPAPAMPPAPALPSAPAMPPERPSPPRRTVQITG